MKTSPEEQVRGLSESTAHDYAAMMDAEIDLPLYTSVLGKLKTKLDNTQGLLIDSSCGSGHMLWMYHTPDGGSGRPPDGDGGRGGGDALER